MPRYQFAHTPAQRSINMSKIKAKNTKPEIVLRKALWAMGIKGYRLHRKDVPGSPDIAFLGQKVAVFIDGAFWHGHNWEQRKPRLNTNKEYWIPKIENNMARDQASVCRLEYTGWTVVRMWDFQLLKDPQGAAMKVASALGRAPIAHNAHN
jgi:DNA mismatch endonuclease, patch repair protein